ncbi:MAG: rhodanese-like domain-containing protein [Altibacter sp.]|uniref:rhodanese-like domain-containing protein n=1 Tax=Altibacter sp. TaxID=2024823 RepID=UPI001E10B3F4|nr:rhodanese-like domain-containing protein [Altibacter sp.]MBZ0326767.1 rhodanese-like domain-containing protein [Altibacter sp.]
MKNILFICVFLSMASATAQESLDNLLKTFNSGSVSYISVQELRRLQVNEPIVILDTREKEEFDVSRIASARYIGYSEFSSENISKMIPKKDTPIVVYCSLGIRSETIGEKLQKAGYTNIKNLYGGIFTWKNAGYQVVDAEGNQTEKVHAYSKIWGKWLLKAEKIY